MRTRPASTPGRSRRSTCPRPTIPGAGSSSCSSSAPRSGGRRGCARRGRRSSGRRRWPAAWRGPTSSRARRSASVSSPRPGWWTSALIALLEEALEAVGEGDSPLRSQLLSGLAQSLYWVDPAGRSDELGIEAVEMARRIDDSESLALALVRRQFTGGTGPGETAPPPAREQRASRPGEAARRPRARGPRPRLSPQRSARARRHPRRRRRPRRLRAARRRAAPAAVPLAHPVAARDAGADRRALRRCRGGSPPRRSRAVNGRRNRSRRSSTRSRIPAPPPAPAPEDDAQARASRCRCSATWSSAIRRSRPGAARWPRPMPSLEPERGAGGVRAAGRERLRGPPPRHPVDDLARRCLPRPPRFSATFPGRERLYQLLLPYDGLMIVAGRAAVVAGPGRRA